MPELFEYLKRIDEISLLEKLNISSEDIVERFGDLIEDRYEQLEEEASKESDGYNGYQWEDSQ